MLKLNYRDLMYLRSVISTEQDTKADYILEEIRKDLSLIPNELIPIAYRAKSDIYLYDDLDIELAMQKLARRNDLKANYSVVIVTPNWHAEQFLYDRLRNLLPATSASPVGPKISMLNGVTIRFISRTNIDAARGHHFDMSIVQVTGSRPNS